MLLIATGVVLTLFAGRLIELQAVRGESLASAALDQRLRTLELPAQRGTILDSGGDALAVTMEARNLTADQTLVTDPAAVAAELGPVLGADPAVLAERLTGDRRFIYLAKGLTPETWDRIEALRLPGIFSEPASRRIYPAGDLAANVVGFVGSDGAGLGGLEYAYQDQLAGVAGTQTFERGPGGRVIPTGANSMTEATTGTTVRLTIDRDIQYVAQQAIAKRVAQSRADSGTIVVMDPRTGEILALATAPTFDPNKAASATDSNRGNRALTNVFEPGSTSKLMTLAAVVNEGKANAYSAFRIPSKLVRGGEDFQDHTPHGTLNLTLAGIMAKSSNIGTILAAERIGGKKLYKYLKKFGIGEPTGLGFPGEATGYVPPHKDWSATSMPTIAFGQGLSVNAVQAASVFATIANDGVRVQPRLVAELVHADGTVEVPAGVGDDAGREPVGRQAGPRHARERRRRGRHGPDGGDPRLPRRRQDRHGPGVQRELPLLQRRRGVLHRHRPGRRPAARRGRVHHEPACGPLRRRARRPGVQGRHDLRAPGPSDPAHRQYGHQTPARRVGGVDRDETAIAVRAALGRAGGGIRGAPGRGCHV